MSEEWDKAPRPRRRRNSDWNYAIALGGFAAGLVLHLFFGASFWLPVVAGIGAIGLMFFGGGR